VRENPKGRRKKAKARLNNYERLLAEDRNVKLDQVQIHIPAGQRLGRPVLEADGVRKGFGERLLIEDLSFTLPPAGIVGVIGPNGAGKTTLFRMIVGDEQPDTGALRSRDRSSCLRRPVRDALDPEKSVWQEISDGYEHIKVGDREVASARLRRGLQLQGLRPAAQGRRALRRRAQPRAPREAPAPRRQRAAARRADQRPRRDTLRALEEALLDFPGCAVIISMTAGSSIASRRTCSPSRATRR
jgi:ATPase subunit of ABC transporter with duplicated ATPase domains